MKSKILYVTDFEEYLLSVNLIYNDVVRGDSMGREILF